MVQRLLGKPLQKICMCPKHLYIKYILNKYYMRPYLLGKVPACDGAGDDHVLARHRELGHPQQTKQVVPLKELGHPQ